MKKLHVQNFSCIETATLEMRRVTLIIGPQASGKSVLCKLAHFFIDIPAIQASAIYKSEPYEKFSARVKKAFTDWFPPAAWGQGKFKIEFSAGDYSASVSRSVYADRIRDDCKIKFSAEFKKNYEELLKETKASREATPEHGVLFFPLEYRVQELVQKSMHQLMGRDAVDNQVFIPAGRSFFTSIGKAIAVFDQGKLLDPLILRFGRMYAASRDQLHYFNARGDQNLIKMVNAKLQAIVGGELIDDGDSQVLRTKDGRVIPLTSLSSGQQELIPMMAMLPAMFNSRSRSICYVEEPEAHLFPMSQGQLLEALVAGSNAASPASQTNLVMTTHSPYVLSKLNNLLKAGSLSTRLSEEGRKELDIIVGRRSWLRARNVRAYAINAGALVDIMGSDGYIDGDYLDMASGQLGEEFDQLLDIEARHAQ